MESVVAAGSIWVGKSKLPERMLRINIFKYEANLAIWTYLDIVEAKCLQNLFFICLGLSPRCAPNDRAHRFRRPRLESSSYVVQVILVDKAFWARMVCMARCPTCAKVVGLLPILRLNQDTWMQDTIYTISTFHSLTTMRALPKWGEYPAHDFVIYNSLEMGEFKWLLGVSFIRVTGV
jgi:hypothetical protein